MKLHFALLLVSWLGLCHTNLASDEVQQQRAHEENMLRILREQEAVSPIPKIYDTRKAPFIILEGQSKVNPEALLFRFANPTKNTVYFRGYLPAQAIRRYQKLQKGIWVDFPRFGYCGTGLGIRQLKPGESTLLEASKEFATPNVRFGIDLFSDEHASSTKTTIWSKTSG